MADRATTRMALWLCYGGMMCVAVATNLTPVYMTTFSEAFGGATRLTDEQLGRIPALMFAGFVLGLLISGPLADRWGAKLFALAGLAVVGAGLGVLGLAWNYAALLLAVAILGFGAGILDMVMSPIVSALHPEQRASALNWLHSFYCMGAVTTTVLASGAIAAGLPWQSVAFALILLPAAVFLGFVPQRVPPLVHEDATRYRLRRLLRQPVFLAALAVILLAGATEISLAQWLPAYAERGLGYSKATGGIALTGFSITMVVGRMSAGVVGHRAQALPLMLISCVALIVLILAGCFLPIAPVALAACVAAGLAVSCLWPTTLALTADRFPHGGASMFGFLAAAGNTGCFIMPWLVGLASQYSTPHQGLATLTACPAIMVAILLWMRSRRDQ